MTKSLRKDFFMEIKKSSSRFISIMLIVALGVAFFAGLRSSNSAMKASADAQYDKENLMDNVEVFRSILPRRANDQRSWCSELH